MEASSKTSNKKRKRDPSVDRRITYHSPSKTFERLFQEHSLDDLKRVVRRKLGLADDLDVQLTQIRGNSFIVLEDEDDFEAFRVALEASSLVEMRVSVFPREDVSQPTYFVPKPNISPILSEMPPPTKKRKAKSDPQKALVSATDAKAGATATATIPTKESGLACATLNKASASVQRPVPLLVSGPTGDQQPNAQTPKLKPKRRQLILSPLPNEPIELPSKEKLDSAPPFRPIVSETLENKKKIIRKQSHPELEEEGSAFVMQIINSVRTSHRTPQEILAAFNNRNLSVKALYRSEITVQPPGEGSSSPPSSVHGRSDDNYDEMDAVEPLLALSAKNIVANLVSRSSTPVSARVSSEMDQMSNEGAKVESGSSENDERPVALLASGHVRRKQSGSYLSKSSNDLSSDDTPSHASRQIALTAPPIVQSASLTRAWSKSTSLLSPTLVAIHPPPEVPETKKFKSPVPHDISGAPGKVGETQDEELKQMQDLPHVANTSAPRSPAPRQPRPSKSLPRLSVLPRTMTRLLLPRSASHLVPTMPNPDRVDEDIVSSDDDSSESDNQRIPANQQAGSRPAFRRHRNVLASF